MRGVSAVLAMDPENARPWDVWDAIALARMHAVNVSHRQRPIFVGQSCLRLLGIRGWSQNPPITIFRTSRRSTSVLPSCTFASTTVPTTSISCSPFPPLSAERVITDGLTTEHPYDALVRCALHEEPLEAFVLGCMALNSWTNFSMFQQDEPRQHSEEIRTELLTRLNRLGHVKGYRRARSILRAIDPGCANPAEAALLWLVRSICPFAITTQVHVGVRGNHYYVDILIEDLHIIIEFDGIAKLGENRGEFERAKREWVLRDQNLRDAGWQVIRVSWPDYNDWEQLRIRLIRTLGPMKPAPEFRSLWKLPSKRCDGPQRRFFSRTTREHSRSAADEPTAHRFPTPRGRKPSGAHPTRHARLAQPHPARVQHSRTNPRIQNAHTKRARTNRSGRATYSAQALGRLPWFAPCLRRSRRLRPRFDMSFSLGLLSRLKHFCTH